MVGWSSDNKRWGKIDHHMCHAHETHSSVHQLIFRSHLIFSANQAFSQPIHSIQMKMLLFCVKQWKDSALVRFVIDLNKFIRSLTIGRIRRWEINHRDPCPSRNRPTIGDRLSIQDQLRQGLDFWLEIRVGRKVRRCHRRFDDTTAPILRQGVAWRHEWNRNWRRSHHWDLVHIVELRHSYHRWILWTTLWKQLGEWLEGWHIRLLQETVRLIGPRKPRRKQRNRSRLCCCRRNCFVRSWRRTVGNWWVSLQHGSRHQILPATSSNLLGIRSDGWTWHWKRHQTRILRKRREGILGHRYSYCVKFSLQLNN